MFDPHTIKQDFPILQRQINGHPLVYLDSAATSQKPRAVIQAITEYYENYNANVHRGVHTLGDESTRLFHAARRTIASFLGAEAEELVIVRNTTEALNQIAYTWGAQNLSRGDVILLTEMEHHSNIVPWQQLAKRTGAKIEFVAVTKEGRLDKTDLHQKLNLPRLKVVAFTHVSNTLGTCNSVAEIMTSINQLPKEQRPLTVVDGAQAAAHMPVVFHQFGVDCYAVSAHKMLGPMGIGALLVRKRVTEQLAPFSFWRGNDF